jgi:hypothetical protein
MTTTKLKEMLDDMIDQEHSFSVEIHHKGDGKDDLVVMVNLKLKSDERIIIDKLKK